MSGSTVFATMHIMRDGYTDKALIALQKALITPGVHRLQVNSLRQGRNQLFTLLASLNCYTSMACISTSFQTQTLRVNLYNQLAQAYRQEPSAYMLSCFIVDRFYYDFIWIELNERLAKQPWFNLVLQEFTETGIIECLPIVLLSL